MTYSHQEQYSPVSKFFHWITVLLIIVQCTVGWAMPEVDELKSAQGLVSLHISIGLLILLVVVARFGWKMISQAPAALDNGSALIKLAAKVVHGSLYLLLAVVPVLGWINAAEREWELSFFGLFPLPKLFPLHSDLLTSIGDLHIASVWALLAFIALHICAAVYHQVIVKDATLSRMLPFTPRK